MTDTSKMTLSQVNAKLKALPLGEHKLTDILQIIQNWDCPQQDTIDCFVNAFPNIINNGQSKIYLKDVWVDLRYQRKLCMTNINKNLKYNEGFVPHMAGHIDVAIRPNGKIYVWDGFRRAIMALMCGVEELTVSEYKHSNEITNTDASKFEAGMFLIKNGKNEIMGSNEIFFARYHKGEEKAVKMENTLRRARINICGLNPGGKNMGAFASVEKALGYQEVVDNKNIQKKILDEYFIDSSIAIQEAWPNSASMVASLLIGLANVRGIIRETNDLEITNCELNDELKAYANCGYKQNTLTTNVIKNKVTESVTYNIFKKVLKKNGQSKLLSGLSDEDLDMLDN